MTRVVIHADDFGLCQPVNEAIVDAFNTALTATSIMAPCIGFEQAAQLYHTANRELDVGLHFTLTTGGFFPKYSPLRKDVPSLQTQDGFFPSDIATLSAHAVRKDVEKELSAQFDRCIDGGLDITHLDAHMFVGSVPSIAEVMLEKAWEWRLPVVIKDQHSRQLNARFDSVVAINADMDIEKYFAGLAGGQGLHYLILHPAMNSEDVVNYLPNTWQNRIADYDLCRTDRFSQYMARHGVTVTGMKEIREEYENANIWL